MRYATGLFFAFVLGVVCHTIYLYNHREFGPSDFCHYFILNRAPSTPCEISKHRAEQILKQRFTYLGYGGQMTAYESEDHRYVIKFFNPRSVIKESWFHRVPKLMRINSWKWISNTYFHQKERLEKYLHRYELSYNDLREETGLIYVHLNPETSLSQTIELVSKNGTLHHLKLDTNPFVLQKKVELTLTHLHQLMNNGKIEEAKEAMRQIYALFQDRAKKGYKDQFQAIEKNYGFVNGKFIQFDTGRIRKDDAVLRSPEQEVARVIANITPSLSAYPELTAVLEECAKKNTPGF